MGIKIKALGYYRKALNIKLKLLGEEHIEVATLYGKIALVYENLSKKVKALEYYKKTIEYNT